MSVGICLSKPGQNLAGWVERLVCLPCDAEETRNRKVQLTIASVLVVPAGVIWSALYFAYGERAVAAIPLVYSVLTLLDLFLLIRLRRYELFRYTEQALILLLPFALQIALGGFVGSSARGVATGADTFRCQAADRTASRGSLCP